MSALSLEKRRCIFKLRTTTMQGKLICDIAPRVKCGRMFWRSHFKVNCSGICKHSYKTAPETMMMTSRQEDKQAHHMAKQQVATVTSSRECVDEQSQRCLSLGSKTPAKRQNMRRRSNSPKCVSWASPSEVSSKKIRNDTQELIRSENMDRRRALVPSH